MGRPLADRLLYFTHDANASEHPKFLALRAHYGGDRGRAMEQRFWQLNGMIAASSHCRLNIRAAFSKPQIAQKLELIQAEFDDFIAFLSDPDRCDLIHFKDGVIWTDRVDEELQHYQESNAKERKRKQEERVRQKIGQQDLDLSQDASQSCPAGQLPLSGVVRPDSSGQDPDNPICPPGQPELSGRTTTIVTRMSGGKTPFSGEAGRQAGTTRKEQLEQSPSTSPAAAAVSPPAGANGEVPNNDFATILRIRLSGAGIALPPEDLHVAADRLVALGETDGDYVSYALTRCKKADPKARASWFLKGIFEYGWVAKWKLERPKKKSTEAKSDLPPALEDMKAERERQEADPVLMASVALDLARNHQRLHMPLTDADRQALAAAGENAADAKSTSRTFDAETAPPLFEEEFEDDLPYPKKPKKDDDEEMLF